MSDFLRRNGVMLVLILVAILGVGAVEWHNGTIKGVVVRIVSDSSNGPHAHVLDETWSADSASFTIDNGTRIERLAVPRTSVTFDTTMYAGTLRWEFAKQSSLFREFWPKQMSVRVWFNPQDPTLRSVSVMEYPDPDGVRYRVPVSASTRIPPNRTLRSLMDVPQLRQGEEIPPPVILYKPLRVPDRVDSAAVRRR